MTTASYKGLKYSRGLFRAVEDMLTVEESLRITIDGTPFTMTMRTPGNEEELVRGLLCTENVFTELNDDPVITVKERSEAGYITWIDVSIPKDKTGPGITVRRNLLSVSSCGVCGKEELGELAYKEANGSADEKISPQTVLKMFVTMNSAQDTFRQSGGSHASAAFTLDGEMLTIREDIGRHNAVDKVVGSLLLRRKLSAARCMTVSGRISYEIVNKCYAAGIPFLAAVSAPSSLAVDMAERLGITLMAFCREDKLTVYSHGEKMISGYAEEVKSEK